MRAEFLPFSRPSITEEDIASVCDVLRSGWITTGPKTSRFEQKFLEYTGCPGAVALTSATAGIHLALKALNIGPGDEVITPSMTWVSTVNLVVLAGAVPVFTDVDRDTLMVTADTIKERITAQTRLIVPVHFAGSAVDMGPVRKLALERGINIIEDAAHALGTRCRNEHVARRGISVFSFHPIKNITTVEGGMFCSDDAGLLERVRRLKFHGLGADAHDRQSQGRAPQAEVIEPGYKYNMTDISAALGLSQLARIEQFIAKRTELAMRYRQLLSGIDEIIPLNDPEYPVRHSWHLFIVRLDTQSSGMSRDEFMQELKNRNIGTGLHFRAVHTQKYYRQNFKVKPDELPNTEWNSQRICSLPLFPDMTANDVDDVVNAIKDVLQKKKVFSACEKEIPRKEVEKNVVKGK